jgi:hypothetical protein
MRNWWDGHGDWDRFMWRGGSVLNHRLSTVAGLISHVHRGRMDLRQARVAYAMAGVAG